MLGQPFTHDMIRKYVIAFGTLFNNVKLQRLDPDTGDTQWISVPLSFASKEKWMQRLQDPNITDQVGVSLPRLSYDLINQQYAPERKLNTINKHVQVNADQDSLDAMYEAVPYDFQFSLHLYCRNAADASNILEQILPFFTPEFTLTIGSSTPMGRVIDCPIVLNSVSKEDSYEGDFESRRTLVWTMDFTMKGLLFGPIQNAKIIKKAYVEFFVPSARSGALARFSNGITLATGTLVGTYGGGGLYKVPINANASGVSNTYDNGIFVVTERGPGWFGNAIPPNHIANVAYYDAHTKVVYIYKNPNWTSTPIGVGTEFYIDYTSKGSVDLDNIDERKLIPTASRIYTQPGLTTDGLPTTDINLSVAVGDIDANDDFGIIQTRTFFPSNTTLAGTRRNLITGDDEYIDHEDV